MIEHKAVTVLNSGIVVDKSKLANLSSNELGTLMRECYTSGLVVYMVDNSGLFFTSKNLIELLKSSDPRWILVTEKFDVILSAEDVRVMSRAMEIQNLILAAIKGSYPFVDVPDGWSIKGNISLKGAIVRRVHPVNGSYSIGVTALRNIWGVASLVWAEVEGAVRTVRVRADGYDKSAVVFKGFVEVGCQNIQRYELEQFALSQSWEFPK